MKLNRVFSIVPDCHAASGHYRGLWQRHFYDGLRNAVTELLVPNAVDFSWARTSNPPIGSALVRRQADTSGQLWSQIQQAHQRAGLDAVISYCFAQDLDPALVRDTIRLGVPWVNFFCDSTHRFAEVEAIARVVSLNWFPETAALTAYRALGVPYLNQPYAYNPEALREAVCTEARFSAAFVGLPTANRITQLGTLLLLGAPLTIRGHGWCSPEAPFHNPTPQRGRLWRALQRPDFMEKIARRFLWPLVRRHAGGPVEDDDLTDFLRQCRVILGLNQGRDIQGRLVSYMKFRDLEFPGYGCCYLTEHNSDLASALAIGQEVLSYSSLIEARTRLRWCQRNQEQARAIGMAGRRRVLADHCWAARLRQLAAIL
jgi:hypothetical protein